MMLVPHKTLAFPPCSPRGFRGHSKIPFRTVLLQPTLLDLIEPAFKRRLIRSQPTKPCHAQFSIICHTLIANFAHKFRFEPSYPLRNIRGFKRFLLHLERLESLKHRLPQVVCGAWAHIASKNWV